MFPNDTKFLVVDDSQLMCSVVTDNLQKLGFKNITVANDGTEAISKLKAAVFAQQAFHVVLTDFWMVDMTGHQLLTECKSDSELNTTRIIFLTAERNKNYINEVMAKGADAYIFKPLTLDTIKKTLEEVSSKNSEDKKTPTYQIISKTEKKATDELIDQSTNPPTNQNDLQLFLNTIPGFVLKITEDGKIQEFNHYLRATFNTSAQEIIKSDFIKSIFEIPSHHLSVELTSLIAGEIAHFHITCQKYKNNTEAILIGTPITSHKKTEENLKLLNSKIASIEDMAANIAYKVNIPLLIVQTRVTRLQKLLAGISVENQEWQDSLKKIEDGAAAIKTTIKGLKNLTRESLKEPTKKVALKKIIDGLSDIWKSKAVENRIDLTFPVISENITLECRENEIFLAVLNLVQNALDAAAQHQEKWVKIDVFEKKDKVEISIIDSGKGIPLELQYQIAKPTHYAKENRSQSGLGLGIAKNIIEDHQGTLIHDPHYPNTRFIISLPVV